MSEWKRKDLFLARLSQIIPDEHVASVLDVFERAFPVVIRFNSLKSTREAVMDFLQKQHINYELIDWCPEVMVLDEASASEVHDWPLYQQGAIYRQSLSSILAGQTLDPQPQERVLDLCAAPGSKTSWMAMVMQNTGHIDAVEVIKTRFYKLKSVLALLGVTNVAPHIMDGRKWRDEQGYDRVLVDAPCSSEGRINFTRPKSYAYWSERKIKEMAHKQKGLIRNAARLLKPGGTMVYSTCTFAPEENEAIVSWLLRKDPDMELVDIHISEKIETYPCLTSWRDRPFHRDIHKCVRVLPTRMMDGFFIAKFEKQI